MILQLVDELLNLNEDQKSDDQDLVRVAFQTEVSVDESIKYYPYTFEDALVAENIKLFSELNGNGMIMKFQSCISKNNVAGYSKEFFDITKNGNKAQFALDLLFLVEPGRCSINTHLTVL